MGGFIGATLRYISSLGFDKIYVSAFPLSTFLINFIGCFILGLLMNMGITNIETWPAKEFVIIGILGGFTTFSAFGVESFQLIESGEFTIAVIYILASVIFGILGIGLSQLIVRW